MKPWLDGRVAIWHQADPFNRFCPDHPTKEGEKSVVGCVALGVAQIMSFYQYPSGYQDHVYDWDEIICSHYSESLAYLLKDLGNPENLEMSYDGDVSGTSSSYIDRTLYNMGYEHVGVYGNLFSVKDAKNALESGPIAMCGFGTKSNGDYVGHFWTVDGYMVYLDHYKFDNNIPMFHCVWGWGGSGNGYFYYRNGFDVNNAEEYDYEPNNPQPNFTYGLEFWSDFKIRN